MSLSSAFVRRSRAAEHFETAAFVTLDALTSSAQRALGQSRFRDGAILRAMLHLRPDDGYAGLNVLDAGASALSDPGTQESLLPSLANAQPPIDLDAVEVGGALEGLLLSTAVLETGSRDAAFALLGRGALVKNRNHHTVLKREWGRLAAFYAAMGQTLPDPLKEVPE